MPELEAERKFSPEIAGGMFKGRKYLILLWFRTLRRDLDDRMPGIGAHLDQGHINGRKAGVVHFKAYDFAELYANRLTYP
ncbi:MAG TPA: hypothetical protein VNV86_07275 [Candidatus Acidoferrum sp.]|jgi:hypothetical protein|nr:hypothetical protein [Candidatus Acidoferrum sp.]